MKKKWVRPLQRADLPAILAIEKEANPSPWLAPDFQVFLNPPSPNQNFILNQNPIPDQNPIPIQNPISKPGGSPCAFVYGDPDIRGFICGIGMGEEGELQNIAVEKSHWGLGIGQALMQVFFDWAKENGHLALHLEVREGNIRAQNFYQQMGFGAVGKRPKYYRDNQEAAILMHLKLLPSPSNNC